MAIRALFSALLCQVLCGAALKSHRSASELQPERSRREPSDGACVVDARFRTHVVVPSASAESTLASGPCDGGCIAFCIFGQLETFFDQAVHSSMADVLIRGFGAAQRNDVLFVLSDVKTPNSRFGGDGDPAPALDDVQCRAFARFRPVAIVQNPWIQDFKGMTCMAEVDRLEKRYSSRYDFLVRSRPDMHWNAMPFNVRAMHATSHPGYAFDDQFAILPRDSVRGTLYGHYRQWEVGAVEWDFPGYVLYRPKRWVGKKSRFFLNPTVTYFRQGGAAHSTDPQRLYGCVTNIIAIACTHYTDYFVPHATVPSRQVSDFDLRSHLEALRQAASNSESSPDDEAARSWFEEFHHELLAEIKVDEPNLPIFDRYGCDTGAELSHALRSSEAFNISNAAWVPRETGALGEC